jgi:hypothetical protein
MLEEKPLGVYPHGHSWLRPTLCGPGVWGAALPLPAVLEQDPDN